MFNEDNNESPKYDAVTGEPVKYDGEHAEKDQTEVVKAETVKAETVKTETFKAGTDQTEKLKTETDETKTIQTETVQDNGSAQYRYSNSEIPFGNSEKSETTDSTAATSFNIKTKPSKKEQKAAAKAAAKNGNGGNKGFKKVVKMVAASVMCGVIAGGTMFGVYYAGVTVFPNSTSAKSAEIATVSTTGIIGNASTLTTGTNVSTSMDVPTVVKAAMPAVVAINGTVTTSTSSGYFNPFSSGTTQSSTSGTGIIVGKSNTELLIVTNAHVVDGVNNLTVSFIDEQSVSATVKGSKSDKDIAVVAVKIADIKSSTISSIAIAELGDSENLQVGEQVVAIGNALGEGQSATVGWISALNRSITIDSTEYSNLIMTDAAINPGNSGGALINANGQVIGINSAKYSDESVEGMGYAIPISSVKDIIDTLSTKISRDKVSDANASYLGISKGLDVTSAMASSYNVPIGAMVGQVASGSAAEKAGLVKGDILVSFDGEEISTFTTLQNLMQYYAAGESVKIAYYHFNSDNKAYEYHEVEVKLGSASSK